MALVVLAAVPAFMLRPTGVMDDSVFWIVAKSLNSGKVLYRDIFFTQPPLFILIPQTVWTVTNNIFVQRSFLIAVWLVNGWLFYLGLCRVDRTFRVLATSLFLASAFILQSYALHTEIFVVTAFLVGAVAIVRCWRGGEFVVGLSVSVALCLKPIGLLVFIPCLYYLVVARRARSEHWLALFLAGAVVPILAVAAYLVAYGSVIEFWQQVVLDNRNVGLSIGADWLGYVTLAFAPLLVPFFVGLMLVDSRPRQFEWWLTAGVFAGLLVLELLRGARHYGLFNLCVLAWMAFRAQAKFGRRGAAESIGLIAVSVLAAVFQFATIREILARGSVTDELSAVQFVDALPHGSLQVFGNDPPRVYMLLNDFPPASAYLFIYDTNRELVRWDSYLTQIDTSPPDYIAVQDNFAAIEYGQVKSTELTDASSVKTWIERNGSYRRLEVGRSLGITMYQRLQATAQGGI
ncbi:MAG: hypothetical protein M3069_04675 [Chloroflexota bacterium]|nr:hypothetical protein [Chloroflexota bacterium]